MLGHDENVAGVEAGVMHARRYGIGDVAHMVNGVWVEHFRRAGEVGLVRAREDDETTVARVYVG